MFFMVKKSFAVFGPFERFVSFVVNAFSVLTSPLHVLHSDKIFFCFSVAISVNLWLIIFLKKPLVHDPLGCFFEDMHPENEHLEAFIFGLAVVVAVINLLGDDR